MDDELRKRLRLLTDRAEIYDCMQCYARGIDRQDRALLRSAHHDGAVDDHGTRTPRHDTTDPSYDRPLAASRAGVVDQVSAQP